MSGLTAPLFNGTVVQCQDVVVSWTGGEYPVRVEAFYQPDATSDWKIAGLPSEAADSNVILWQANVPAGTYAWITLVDHSGAYRQSPQGVMVQPSDDDSCLESSQTASVVTQTVFMSGDGKGSEAHLSNGLDDKALLILSICFGILAFAALALAVLLYSRLRQARRARMRGGKRFSLVDDDYHQSSAFDGPRNRASNAAMAAGSGAAFGAMATGAMKERRNEKTTAGAGRRESNYEGREKGGLPSPNTSLGEHNPFLDPPLSANSDHSPTSFTYDNFTNNTHRTSILGSSNGAPTIPAGAFISRPDMRLRSPSNADTLNSATSMQLFDSRAGGGVLRVANDPSQIETPNLSREVTRSSVSSRYPTTIDGTESSLLPDSTSSRRSSVEASATAPGPVSNDGHSLRSSRSGRTDVTADHYASEPHSSKVWLNASRQPTK